MVALHGVLTMLAAGLLAAPSAPASAQAAGSDVIPPVESSHVLRGRLQLSTGGRALRSEEAVDAVVYFRPAAGFSAPAPPALPLVLATERKTFSPRVLPVPLGATVRFPNNDPILHNVFSTSREAAFDLGLYGRGDGEQHTFTQAGVVRVFCNVHHSMVAHVLVMDTPHFVKPDGQGRFRLAGIPAGAGELFVWHERAPLWRRSLEVPQVEDLVVALELSRRKVPAHLNKHGQPYRRARPDEY